MTLKVLSLCDGLSGISLAFNKLGIEVEVHAVETDRQVGALADFNVQVVRWKNDVNSITESDIVAHGPYDWVVFGSPCQSVSVAGDGSGLNGSSGLLIKCMEILKLCQKHNPSLKYIIENVKMKKEFYSQFVSLIGHEAVLINAALVSAQKRERYYWCNFSVPQPTDRRLLLKDVLESTPDKSMIFSPGEFDQILNSRVCLDDSEIKGVTLKDHIIKSQKQVVFAYSSSSRAWGIDRRSNISGKANTLATGSGGSSGNRSINGVANISPTGITLRKLTVRECARLQTIPDWFHLNPVSKTHAYKAIGNGWCTEVIIHILRCGLHPVDL